MKSVTGIELLFENCDSIVLPVEDITINIDNVTKCIDFSGGSMLKLNRCEYASLIIPKEMLELKTRYAQEFETDANLEQYIDSHSLDAVTFKLNNGREYTVYTPWTDEGSEEYNTSQHTYYGNELSDSFTDKDEFKYIKLYLFDMKSHPEYGEYIHDEYSDVINEINKMIADYSKDTTISSVMGKLG